MCVCVCVTYTCSERSIEIFVFPLERQSQRVRLAKLRRISKNSGGPDNYKVI